MKSLTDEMRKTIKGQLTARPVAPPRPNVQRRTKYSVWCKPHHSDALGVSPDQIEEAKAHLRSHGVTADFDKQGRCILTSEKQYREVARACGMYDGAHGFQVKNEDGQRILTGLDRKRERERMREKIRRGEISI